MEIDRDFAIDAGSEIVMRSDRSKSVDCEGADHYRVHDRGMNSLRSAPAWAWTYFDVMLFST